MTIIKSWVLFSKTKHNHDPRFCISQQWWSRRPPSWRGCPPSLATPSPRTPTMTLTWIYHATSHLARTFLVCSGLRTAPDVTCGISNPFSLTHKINFLTNWKTFRNQTRLHDDGWQIRVGGRMILLKSVIILRFSISPWFLNLTYSPVTMSVLVEEVGGLSEGHGAVAGDEVILNVPQQSEQSHHFSKHHAHVMYLIPVNRG